jgi:1,4-dihydroxy-2-naphthoate octaprenyltransferase
MWSAIVILTTIHVQDFADVEGDAAMGRRTLPIISPVGSRLLAITTITAYSWYVAAFWATGPAVQTLFMLYGFAIAFRCACYRDCRQDKRTYVMYNV